jgi:ribosomal subunit interface protein
MRQEPEISFKNIEHSLALESKIRERIERLERYADQIIGCRVSVQAPHRQHRDGNIYEIHIQVSVPGKDIYVTKDHGENGAHDDIYVAVRDAFEAAEKQLKKTSGETTG